MGHGRLGELSEDEAQAAVREEQVRLEIGPRLPLLPAFVLRLLTLRRRNELGCPSLVVGPKWQVRTIGLGIGLDRTCSSPSASTAPWVGWGARRWIWESWWLRDRLGTIRERERTDDSGDDVGV